MAILIFGRKIMKSNSPIIQCKKKKKKNMLFCVFQFVFNHLDDLKVDITPIHKNIRNWSTMREDRIVSVEELWVVQDLKVE